MILVPLLLLCVLIHCHRLLILPTHNKKFTIQTGLVRIVKASKSRSRILTDAHKEICKEKQD